MDTVKLSIFLIRFRLHLVLVTVLIAILMATQLSHIKIDSQVRALFDDDNPGLVRLLEIEDTYIQSQNLLFFVSPSRGTLFTKENLQLLQEMTEESWLIPYSSRVESLTNYKIMTSVGDSFRIESLVDEPAALLLDDLKAIRKSSLSETQILGRLVSKDLKAAVIMVSLALPEDYTLAVPKIMHHARTIKESFEVRYPGLKVYINGDIAFEGTYQETALREMKLTFPLIFSVLFVLIGVLLRSFFAVISIMCVVVVSEAIAMGISVALKIDFNAISILSSQFILILAVADSVHIMSQYIINLRLGMPKQNAMQESIVKNFKAISLTSVTTGIGFLGMNFGDSPDYADLGNITAIGALVAFVVSFSVLPAVGLALPIKQPQSPLLLTKALNSLSAYVVRRNNMLFWGVIILSAVVISFVPRLQISDDMEDIFVESVEFHESMVFARENLSGAQVLLVSIDSGEVGGVNNPDFLHNVDGFTKWLRRQPNVGSVDSYVDIVKNLNKAMHANDEGFYRVPKSRELASQYLLLYELSLPVGQDLTKDLSHDRSSLRVTISLKDSDNINMIRLEETINIWLKNNVPEVKGITSGLPLIMSHRLIDLIYGMVNGSAFTLFFITIVLIFGLKSLKYGILSILPNLLPAAIVYGAWSILGGHINQPVAVTFSISLGVVVDDTVHIITKYLQARKMGESKEEAIRFAFTTTGTALLVTTLALISGMALMGLSDFATNQTMAGLLCSIVFVALVLDFLFLPAVLIRFDKGR